jgi:hypothetical protein
MPYTLHRLAAGSYDLLLRGKIIGSVVRNVSSKGDVRGWRVELIEDLPPEQRPRPFTKSEHAFRTLNAAWEWLGDPIVAEDFRPPRAQHRRAVDRRIKSPADAHLYGRNAPE